MHQYSSKTFFSLGICALMALTVITLLIVLRQSQGVRQHAAENEQPGVYTILGPSILSATDGQGRTLSQQGWLRYTGADAPEGGYMVFLNGATISSSATIALSKTLTPGQYYVFVKGINYDQPINATVSLGGGTAIATMDQRDSNGYWSNGYPLTISTSTNTLSLIVKKNTTADAKLLFTGLYITTNSRESILRNDIVTDLAKPTVMDTTPPVRGNLIENSSFETGIGHGWSLGEGKNISIGSIYDGSAGYHGKASVRLPFTASARSYGEYLNLVSKVYHVKPNKQYTLSAWVRTSGNGTYSGTISMKNTYGLIEQTPIHALSQGFTPTSTWQRVSVTGYLLEWPTADYVISIAIRCRSNPSQASACSNDSFAYIDAIQLEEGPAPTAYMPKLPVEIGLFSSTAGNVYYDTEAVTMQFRAFNNSTVSSTQTLKYTIYDLLNKVVKEGTKTIPIPSSTLVTEPFDLSVEKRGIFRVVMQLVNVNGSEEEVVYAVVPPPQRAVGTKDDSSIIGSHLNSNDYSYEVFQKLGVKWDRALSPGAYFRWNQVEPVDNQFVWKDEEVNRANTKGMMMLGTIGTNDYWPSWANNGGVPNLDKWQEFVYQLVTHYKGTITYWEIWNEPNRTGFVPAFYAQMLKSATDAIEQVERESNGGYDAKIVGLGGTTISYMKDVIGQLQSQYPSWSWNTHLDALSTHAYPTGLGEGEIDPVVKSDIIDKYNIPVWNTESGTKDWTFAKGSNSSFVSWGRSLWPHSDAERYYESSIFRPEQQTSTIIQSLGVGHAKYFYYDSRLYTSHEYLRSHFTNVEYDDTIRPKGIAYGVIAYLLDHSKTLGKVSVKDSNTAAYLFNSNGAGVAALYTVDNRPKTIALSPQCPSGFVIYDIMGNPLPSATQIAIGRLPSYVECKGINAVSNLQNSLLNAVITNRVDNAAPNISISDGPFGNVDAQKKIRFRWIAIDETSAPSVLEPLAIGYSYRLIKNGTTASFSTWSANTYIEYIDLPEGSYIFEVKAKDAAGNESSVKARAFSIGAHAVPSISISAPTPTLSIMPATATPITLSPTSVTSGTRLGLNVFLHGIGKGGDNVNPTGIGTQQPLHPQRSLTVQLFNATNQLVYSGQTTITFTANSGNFPGILSLPTTLAPGQYLVKLKSPQYISKLVPNIISIQSGQLTTLLPVFLIAGDTNDDNLINIQDYQRLIDCFSDILQPRNCSDAGKKQRTDLTDDGNVNQFDYNLLLRELSVQTGE